MAQIMVVDDEVGIRELLSEILQDEGHQVLVAENAGAARALRTSRRPDLVLLDIWMPDTDGISLLKEWSGAGMLNMPVVMMSGHGTIDTAVEATRIGAVDFLEKPIALQKLLGTVKKALRHDTPPPRSPLSLTDLKGVKSLRDLARRLEQAAEKTSVLFLKGAAGWLAELCARNLHAPQTPWVDLSTSSAPLTQEGLEQAAGGVLFVPELGTLGRMQQMNLGFAIDRLAKNNLLLVCATAKSSAQLQEAGFDPLLLTRLSVVWVSVPSLAAQPDDVPEVATLLLHHLVERGEVPLRRLSTGALNALRLHAWEGDWNELQAVIRNLALTALDEEIGEAEVAVLLGAAMDGQLRSLQGLLEQPLREARDAFERLYLEHHLRQERGNMTRLAERSGLERTHLYRKLKQLGVAMPRRGED